MKKVNVWSLTVAGVVVCALSIGATGLSPLLASEQTVQESANRLPKTAVLDNLHVVKWDDVGTRIVQLWDGTPDTNSSIVLPAGNDIAVRRILVKSGHPNGANGAHGAFVVEMPMALLLTFLVDGYETKEYTFDPPLVLREGTYMAWYSNNTGNEAVDLTLFGTPLPSDKITVK